MTSMDPEPGVYQIDPEPDALRHLRKQVDRLQQRMSELVTENRALRAEVEHRRKFGAALSQQDRRGDVVAFFGIAGQGPDIGATPHVPPDRSLRLGLRLVAEEFFEVLDAAFLRTLEDGDDDDLDHAREMVLGAIDENLSLRVDLAALADGVIDSFYVLEGLLVRCGIDPAPLWEAVHAANMQKASGPTDPTTGKRLKPPGWTPPDIEGELKRQGWRP